MTAAAGGPAAERADARTWITVIGCMLGALIAVLDIQITNSSLPDIEGGISTGVDNGTWISTAYLIGEIIMIPLTAYLTRVFTFRRFLLVNTALFLVFSVACGFATSLGEMIVTRFLQGLTGGVMIPMAFTAVLTRLPAGQRPVGIAMFAMTATFGPAIGPTIGGWLTETYGWQTIFYVNLVPGAVMLALLFPTLEREPMRLDLLREGDWWGIATMTVGLACLQTVLDEGDQKDWLGSPEIVWLSLAATVFLAAFVAIELTVEKPAVQLRLLLGRNFGLGTLAVTLVGVALFGSVYVLPTYLDEVQGYNAQQIGLVLAWVGLPQLLIIPLVPWILRRVDARVLVCTGLVVFAASCFLNTHLSADVGGDQLIATNVVRALGQAILLSPLTAVTMSAIAPADAAAASGIYNMLRSLGGAFGTAALATIIDKREQFHSSIIGQSVTPFGATVRDFLGSVQGYFVQHGVADPAYAHHRAEVLLGTLIRQQARIMAFSDTFAVLGGVLLVAAVAVVLTRRYAPAAGR